MVSSAPGSMSSPSGKVISVLGTVGAVVGAVVGLVVGAVLGRVVGAMVLGVVFSLDLLRQPVKAHRVRTATKATQRNFFILKPPDITDFTTSISKEDIFTLEKTVWDAV